MPAWRQAPILTEKAGRERSHPHASVAQQAGTFPQAGSTAKVWAAICRLPLRHRWGVFLPLDYSKGSGSPQSRGLFQTSPHHTSCAFWLSYFIYNLCRGLFGKQSKAWMGFSVILFLIYISARPRSLMWKNTRRKRRPHCRSCLATPSGACALRMLWILGDRPNHSY